MTSTQPGPAPAVRDTGSLLLIGDSLSVELESLLPEALPGWDVKVDAMGGRPLAEGMRILGEAELPGDGSTVLAMGLFTNDDPRETAELNEGVATSLRRVGRDGCVIWATLAGPPAGGAGYEGANQVLYRLAAADGRLRIVPWAEHVAARPALLIPDRVHGTPEAYRLRARLYAEAARSCRALR